MPFPLNLIDGVGQKNDFQNLLPSSRRAFSPEYDGVGQPDVSESADLTFSPFTLHPRIPNAQTKVEYAERAVFASSYVGINFSPQSVCFVCDFKQEHFTQH